MRITAKDVCSICLEELDPDTVLFEPSVSHRRLVLFFASFTPHYRDANMPCTLTAQMSLLHTEERTRPARSAVARLFPDCMCSRADY